jgi:predicted nucleic acid-binding protein
MIVIDASAVVNLLTLGQGPQGRAVAVRIDASRGVYAPAHMDFEVVKVVRRLVFQGTVANTHADKAVEALQRLPITRVPLLDLLPRAWELRHNAYPGDALYLALAEDLGCPLVTTDGKLAGTPGHHAVIHQL